jgi:L-rhamnose isomerase/sugar isomerase
LTEEEAHRGQFQNLADSLQRRGVDVESILSGLEAFTVETPSWAYADSGTRFKVFAWPGAARTLWEKLEDAATVHRFTGACPTVALHIPWDRVDDWSAASQYATERGIRIGSINPNLFQEDAYRLGSLAHPHPKVRQRAVEHVLECLDIARKVDSNTLVLWLADGTNYPGQDDLRSRRRRLQHTLREIYSHLKPKERLLIEYKFFEPAMYHTDVADWGAALTLAQDLGPQAQVVVDMGHHAQGTNLAYVVALLLEQERLGGFHLNDRQYADDDLMVGSLHPFQLFLVLCEVVAARQDHQIAEAAGRVAFMIDQSHNIEPKVEAVIQSVLHVQRAYAQALLVNREELRQAQEEGDVLGAYRLVRQAFDTDVGPLLAEMRLRRGLPLDPVEAFRKSGYAQEVAQRRGVAQGTTGYPGAQS